MVTEYRRVYILKVPYSRVMKLSKGTCRDEKCRNSFHTVKNPMLSELGNGIERNDRKVIGGNSKL